MSLIDPHKKTISLKSNIEFLKKFQGKKSIISKNGLISGLNIPEIQIRSSRLNNHQVQNIRQVVITHRNSQIKKLGNTEPSQIPKELCENQFINVIQPLIKTRKGESLYKHAITRQKRQKRQKRQGKVNQTQIQGGQSRMGKLPRLTVSKSERSLQNYHKVISKARLNANRVNNHKLNPYQIGLKNHVNAVEYLKQLQKFQNSLKNFQQKSNLKFKKGSK